MLIIDKRDHIAGKVHSKKIEGIEVHQYGAHIFHTNDTQAWNHVHQFAAFNRFTNSLMANKKGKRDSLPFNMYFGGRLGEYKYYDVDAVIAAALKKSGQGLGE